MPQREMEKEWRVCRGLHMFPKSSVRLGRAARARRTTPMSAGLTAVREENGERLGGRASTLSGLHGSCGKVVARLQAHHTCASEVRDAGGERWTDAGQAGAANVAARCVCATFVLFGGVQYFCT